MNNATVRAPRSVKLPAFADIFVRDFQDRLASSDARIRRWERIALKERA